MLEFKYICIGCGKEKPEYFHGMICPYCQGDLRGTGCPGITGTRDNFGVMKSFKDINTGKTIDNWKSWEKAGYRNPMDVVKDKGVKSKIKDKVRKINKKPVTV